MIEAAARQSYGTELQQRILAPLELRQTYLPNGEMELPEPHARGYLPVNGELVDITNFDPSQAWAAGAIVSTAADLNRFYAALLTGVLLSPAELETLQSTVPTDAAYHRGGCGVSRLELPDLTVWGHSGGIFGYRTWSYHSGDAARQLTLSLACAHGAPPETYALLGDVFR
ncbi:serine hydrolase [Kribbella flavida]|uniref:serine hydrolase n=1 Tax=Kribbella flavida TaxID=182640 RepID=UPI00067418EE